MFWVQACLTCLLWIAIGSPIFRMAPGYRSLREQPGWKRASIAASAIAGTGCYFTALLRMNVHHGQSWLGPVPWLKLVSIMLFGAGAITLQAAGIVWVLRKLANVR